MQIEVWSDFACPWCAVGLFRLDAALAQLDDPAAVAVVHRSFELHPGAPPRREGSYADAVARKYGVASESVRKGEARLAAMGAEVGFTFDFASVRLGNTFDAHRIAQAARGLPCEHDLI